MISASYSIDSKQIHETDSNIINLTAEHEIKYLAYRQIL